MTSKPIISKVELIENQPAAKKLRISLEYDNYSVSSMKARELYIYDGIDCRSNRSQNYFITKEILDGRNQLKLADQQPWGVIETEGCRITNNGGEGLECVANHPVSFVLRYYLSIKYIIEGESSECKNFALSDSSHKPFGFLPADVNGDYSYANQIGVTTTRVSRPLTWRAVQPNGVGPYNWEQFDEIINKIPSQMDALVNISPEGGRQCKFVCLPGSYEPRNSDSYSYFVKAAVQRYRNIRYWQVGNEPEVSLGSGFAKLQEITYTAIKSVRPDAKVIIGGQGSFINTFLEDFKKEDGYGAILRELGGQFVDILDFHVFGDKSQFEIKDPITGQDLFDYVKAKLEEYHLSSLSIWVAELGIYSGDPFGPDFSSQTERDQARDVIRKYFMLMSKGVEKIFPAFGMIEGFTNNDSYFDHTGFIYDGLGSNDLGKNVKKLSYYSYWKMTNTFADAHFDTIEVKEARNGYFILKMMLDRGTGWLVWKTGSGGILRISSVTEKIKVTNLIPKMDLGRNITSFENAFNEKEYVLSSGKIDIFVGEDPLFILDAESVDIRY